ncbi:MAG TPA: hypothetical protein VF715_02070 [Thermoleophilaceae bacterium]|jgi:hypothetical protein
MADREPHEETAAEPTLGKRAPAEAAKAAMEQDLIAEVVREPEAAMSFSRIFNKDAPDFSRIFSRGGAHLERLTVRDLTTLEETAFVRFTERVRVLQDMAPTEKPE